MLYNICHVMLYDIYSEQNMLYNVIMCLVMLCYITCVMLCYTTCVMLSYHVSCYVI